MQYKKIIKALSDEITETYQINGVDYHGSLEVHSLGYISGMAGNDEHSVTITLRREYEDVRESEQDPFGSINLTFPIVKRDDNLNPQRMLEQSDSKNSIRRFSPYALQKMDAAVGQFIAMKLAWKAKGFTIKQASVSVDR